MKPETKKWLKTIAWAATSVAFCAVTVLVYKSIPKDEEATKKQAANVDEVRSLKEGDLYYMYHVRDGKLVDFGDQRFVMSEANKLAAKNSSRVLSVSLDAGHTVGGADVTAGVYVALLKIVDGQIVLK